MPAAAQRRRHLNDRLDATLPGDTENSRHDEFIPLIESHGTFLR